jgi:hypothetical protein
MHLACMHGIPCIWIISNFLHVCMCVGTRCQDLGRTEPHEIDKLCSCNHSYNCDRRRIHECVSSVRCMCYIHDMTCLARLLAGLPTRVRQSTVHSYSVAIRQLFEATQHSSNGTQHGETHAELTDYLTGGAATRVLSPDIVCRREGGSIQGAVYYSQYWRGQTCKQAVLPTNIHDRSRQCWKHVSSSRLIL